MSDDKYTRRNTRTKLPIILTFEIARLPAPNDHWYEVTGVLTFKDFTHRLDTSLVLQHELSVIKESIELRVKEQFDIGERREQQSDA